VNAEGELDKLENRTRPDPIGPRYNRTPAAVAPVSGPGGGDRYAKVTAVKDDDDTAWADFATDGFPSHYEATPCAADGTAAGTTVLHLLGAPDPDNDPSGLICQTDDVVLWRPLDGSLAVPGDAATVLDGLVLAGVSAGRFYPKVID